MQWENLYSHKRTGKENKSNNDSQIIEDQIVRSGYQRDYDRLIFSSPFRRLQNKTQVFPIPGSIFVHNRLTHSLEVASVGRSIANIIGQKIIQQYKKEKKTITEEFERFYTVELSAVISSACLAHDIGNPPFGHSGEKAISKYFFSGKGKNYKNDLSDTQWNDLINFEGNANAFRILTHHFNGRSSGGYSLTYTTLASMLKYPCSSIGVLKGENVSRKKYGFFDSETETFKKIVTEFDLPKTSEKSYCRHPFVFLVEAADDISYRVIDWEDAYRLGIFTPQEAEDLLIRFFEEDKDKKELESLKRGLGYISDKGERIAFLRAKTINLLITECINIFWKNHELILEGKYEKSLIDEIPGKIQEALKYLGKKSVDKIYNHRSVIEIELAGYTVLGGLLEEFIPAVLENNSHYDAKLIQLIPDQFLSTTDNVYSKIQSVTDFISGMTDLYAVEMYRKIKGISFPGLMS